MFFWVTFRIMNECSWLFSCFVKGICVDRDPFLIKMIRIVVVIINRPLSYIILRHSLLFLVLSNIWTVMVRVIAISLEIPNTLMTSTMLVSLYKIRWRGSCVEWDLRSIERLFWMIWKFIYLRVVELVMMITTVMWFFIFYFAFLVDFLTFIVL